MPLKDVANDITVDTVFDAIGFAHETLRSAGAERPRIGVAALNPHAQNDLHTTTNILATPLASRCVKPFSPARGGAPASAECRTSEITLAEYRTLTPKMDAADRSATTVEAYLGGTADWRTNLYAAEPATLMIVTVAGSCAGRSTALISSILNDRMRAGQALLYGVHGAA